jgi:hypothetical protein
MATIPTNIETIRAAIEQRIIKPEQVAVFADVSLATLNRALYGEGVSEWSAKCIEQVKLVKSR